VHACYLITFVNCWDYVMSGTDEGMRNFGRVIRGGEEIFILSLSPPQIPCGMEWYRMWVSAVRIRRLSGDYPPESTRGLIIFSRNWYGVWFVMLLQENTSIFLYIECVTSREDDCHSFRKGKHWSGHVYVYCVLMLARFVHVVLFV